MIRTLILIMLMGVVVIDLLGSPQRMVVADSLTRQPLPSATVFDSHGNTIGISDAKGRLPAIKSEHYPVTVRYLGYRETEVSDSGLDTIFMAEVATELPEVTVEDRRARVLHVLAYVREYSSLTTYFDTIFLFREKMVDYMITPDRRVKYKGWEDPRILKSRSYYRFTNTRGLDSVSDGCNHHFSWSDWVGISEAPEMPARIRGIGQKTETIYGKYSSTEVWTRSDDRVTVDVNVLADTLSQKWVPHLSTFFREKMDFEDFRVRYNYDNVTGDTLRLTDLTGYSFNIASKGRGRNLFRFSRKDQQYFVNTYAEVYILDKEYITTKEAKQWEEGKIDTTEVEIIEPATAPALQPAIEALVARVDNIDHDGLRLGYAPDKRLMGKPRKKQNFGQRALSMLKGVTGISYFQGKKMMKKEWNEFVKQQMEENNSHYKGE
ncbi:MAG: hypothetical protein ACI4AK_01740 [Lepagella sp.]